MPQGEATPPVHIGRCDAKPATVFLSELLSELYLIGGQRKSPISAALSTFLASHIHFYGMAPAPNALSFTSAPAQPVGEHSFSRCALQCEFDCW
jgi:hypothetical protein